MTPAELGEAVLAAVRQAVEAGELAVAVPERAVVAPPRERAHGDYATPIAMQLAKPAGSSPREVAQLLATRLRAAPGIGAVAVAGPGFLNITLEESALGEIARTVVGADKRYGNSDRCAGQKINLEFVSANPTGPVHIGGVRWAAVGDALARLLEATGADVTREYYFNDTGAQIDRFAASLYAAARGAKAPEGGYAGAYVDDLAGEVVRREPGVLDLPAEPALAVFRREGIELMFTEIRTSLADFGVQFDVYVNERDLHARGELDAALQRLRSSGQTYEDDGALWIRSRAFGDNEDHALVRSDGRPTYIAADAAYYLDKRRRGFDKVMIMLGADHHGYVGRYRAVVAGLGDDPDQTLEILIGQLVNLVRGGEPVRMSKRAGTFATLEDLVDAVGVDAARYALARYSVDSTIDLDLDLWTRQTNDNPVFYVQYAHARIASLLRHAADLGVTRGDDYDPAVLSHEREGDLLRVLGEFPRVVASAAELREPHRVARYLEELAGVYHRFYDACRVLPRGADQDEAVGQLTRARLWLCEATRLVLANGLGLLGVSAPDRM